MYELHMKVYVKIGDGEDALYGVSERRPPLTAEELADPAALEALAEECLESMKQEPEAQGKTVTTVSYEEYHQDEIKLREQARLLFGGMDGMGGGLAALLGGMGFGSDEHDCASCDAEDCPSRTAEFSENLN